MTELVFVLVAVEGEGKNPGPAGEGGRLAYERGGDARRQF